MSVLTSNYLRLGLTCALLAGSLTTLAQVPDPLLPAERAWLAAHPHIRVASDPDYPPVEFFDDQGLYRGTAAETLMLLG